MEIFRKACRWFADGIAGRFFWRLRAGCGSKRSFEPALWPVLSSSSGSDFQGVRPRAAVCCHTRSTIEAHSSQHERPAMNIALVEYGAGNLPSVERALTRLGVESRRASTPEAFASCDALILPGVGHFGALMRSLAERSLVTPLRNAVASGVPLLGICLGLQAMFASSDEAVGDAGLGLFPQKVSALPATDRLPHMGWNQLRRVRPSSLLEGVPEDAYFYFAHTYAALDAGEAEPALFRHKRPLRVAVRQQKNFL